MAEIVEIPFSSFAKRDFLVDFIPKVRLSERILKKIKIQVTRANIK
ncbi:hypothetical protein [Lysinibacillus sp. NPDC093692]